MNSAVLRLLTSCLSCSSVVAPDNDGTKVREHEVLVDVEGNKHFGGDTFVGTGISFWDITHSDTLRLALTPEARRCPTSCCSKFAG